MTAPNGYCQSCGDERVLWPGRYTPDGGPVYCCLLGHGLPGPPVSRRKSAPSPRAAKRPAKRRRKSRPLASGAYRMAASELVH